MGNYTNNPSLPIFTLMENKTGGNAVKFPLMTALASKGVGGNSKLVGNEEPIGRYQDQIILQQRRTAVEVSTLDEHFTFAQALPQARPLLQIWSRENLRDDIIDSLGMVADYKTMHVPLNNSAATNAQSGSYQFSVPVPGSAEFYKLRSP